MLIVLLIISVLVNLLCLFVMLQMSLNHRSFKETVEGDLTTLFTKARALESGKMTPPSTPAPAAESVFDNSSISATAQGSTSV